MFRRCRFPRGTLIHCDELTAEEREQAQDPGLRLAPSDVFSPISGLPLRQDGRPGREMLEAAITVGAPEPRVLQCGGVCRDYIGRALEQGILIALRATDSGVLRSSSTRPPAPTSPVPGPEAAPGTEWLAVEVVDELGAPVDGLELIFTHDGGQHRATTDGDGRAQVGCEASFGSVRFANPAAVRQRLDERWSQPSAQEWPAAGADAAVIEVCATGLLPSVPLEAKADKRIVLQPPFRVRLHDADSMPMAHASCRITIGQEVRRVTCDANGWLELPIGASCPESVDIEWGNGSVYVNSVALACNAGDEESVAKARLQNLGYPAAQNLEMAIAMFLSTRAGAGGPESPPGQLSADACQAIAAAWDEDGGEGRAC